MRNHITHRLYGTTPDGNEVTEFALTNRNGLEVKAINYGCTITSLKIPDRKGKLEDVVLGFDHLEGYLQSKDYIGCIVGRYANRIANGKFTLDGKEYSLSINHPPHHLHGGVKGYNQHIWNAEEIKTEQGVGIRFTHLSPDGDEGYPGNVHLEVVYLLGDDNTLSINYHAVSDQKTIINLTQHSYFNLTRGRENILNHELLIPADHYLPVDESMIPTGEIRTVNGTPFDFRKKRRIGDGIILHDPQLAFARGYDHTWVLNRSGQAIHHASTLHDPGSGRTLVVYTSEPGIQLYSANFLGDHIPGKSGMVMGPNKGLCLETQHFPDSPNHSTFPSVILQAGQKIVSQTLWKFSVQ